MPCRPSFPSTALPPSTSLNPKDTPGVCLCLKKCPSLFSEFEVGPVEENADGEALIEDEARLGDVEVE